MTAFDVSFASARIVRDPFENTHKFLLDCATGRGKLVALGRTRCDWPQLAEPDPGIPFQPHMTVATNRARAALEGLGLADAAPPPLHGRKGALEVVRLAGWRLAPLETLPLDVPGDGNS